MKNKKLKTQVTGAGSLLRMPGQICLFLVCISGGIYAQGMKDMDASESHNEAVISSTLTEQQLNQDSSSIGNNHLPENDRSQMHGQKNFLFRIDKSGVKTGPGDAANYTGEGKTAVLKSLIVPGWGLYTASQRPMSWINTPVCYGLVGYGVYQMTAGSAKEYQKYMDLRVPGEMDKQFDKSNTTFVTGIGITCVGALLWARQVILTSSWAKKNEFYRKRAAIWNENLALGITPVRMDPQTTGFCLSATLKIK